MAVSREYETLEQKQAHQVSETQRKVKAGESGSSDQTNPSDI